MNIGKVCGYYRCNLLTLFFIFKSAAVHFYVNGLCFSGSLQCLYDFFLYCDHPSHHLCKAVSQLVCFFGRDHNLSFAFLSQGSNPTYEIFYGSSLNLGIV